MLLLWLKPLRWALVLRTASGLAWVVALSGAASLTHAQVEKTTYLIASNDHLTLTSGSEILKNACAQDLETAAPSLVYMWSPRMVLSALHADVARQQAALHGLQFTPLHDPRLPAPEVQEALARLASSQPASAAALHASAPLCHAGLLGRLALRHFPTAFVWMGAPSEAQNTTRTGHGWAAQPIVGAMPAAYWSRSILARLGDVSGGGLVDAHTAPSNDQLNNQAAQP
jgi:hypothetical protein